MSFRRTARRWALALGLTAATAAAGYAAVLVATGNFHVLVAGEAYRSAQPSPNRIRALKAQYGVATILNLRGENIGKPWYDAEAAAARDAGLTLLNFRLSASEDLTDAAVAKLIALMRDAPKPLLIHCRNGADRTGIASALYVAAIKGEGEEAAERQLSPLYGHVAFFGTPNFAMERTWEANEPALGFPDS